MSMLDSYGSLKDEGLPKRLAYARARYQNTAYPDALHLHWETVLFDRHRLPLRYLSNREVVIHSACKTRAPRCSLGAAATVQG
jgi:hypothetical protein